MQRRWLHESRKSSLRNCLTFICLQILDIQLLFQRRAVQKTQSGVLLATAQKEALVSHCVAPWYYYTSYASSMSKSTVFKEFSATMASSKGTVDLIVRQTLEVRRAMHRVNGDAAGHSQQPTPAMHGSYPNVLRCTQRFMPSW
mgnify:CR=1 FL=1